MTSCPQRNLRETYRETKGLKGHECQTMQPAFAKPPKHQPFNVRSLESVCRPQQRHTETVPGQQPVVNGKTAGRGDHMLQGQARARQVLVRSHGDGGKRWNSCGWCLGVRNLRTLMGQTDDIIFRCKPGAQIIHYTKRWIKAVESQGRKL